MNSAESDYRSPAPDYDKDSTPPAPKKRGRPVTGNALSQAQRDGRYHAKKRFAAAVADLRKYGLSPYEILRTLDLRA